MARGEDEGDEGGGEEHLDDGNVTIFAAEDLGEGVGVVDAEALGCAWSCRQREGGSSDQGRGRDAVGPYQQRDSCGLG